MNLSAKKHRAITLPLHRAKPSIYPVVSVSDMAIARAVMKQPEIYVFDDSFSALDMKTDHQLRQNLKENIKDATVILVAQRISTIIDADRILVVGRWTNCWNRYARGAFEHLPTLSGNCRNPAWKGSTLT